MRKNVGTIVAVSVLLSLVVQSCSTTKKLETQATSSSITHSSGHLEDVLRSAGLTESWVVPAEHNGVVVYDTIRHRVDWNDTIHHRVDDIDTLHSQVLAEQTKAKVPRKQTGLRESINSVGRASNGSGVALIISVGMNIILILVILSVYFLKSNR